MCTLFDCVLALTLTSLLQRALHRHGLDLSLKRMMELLGGIKEVLLIYPRQQGEQILRAPPPAGASGTPSTTNFWTP